MTADQVKEVMKEAMMVAFEIAGPLLIISIVVGLIVAIFQAATQIHEQTLTFVPKLLVIALVLLVLAFIMLKYTKFGRSIYAIGGNEQSALMMGLNVRRVKLKAYILDGFLCGVGSVLSV